MDKQQIIARARDGYNSLGRGALLIDTKLSAYGSKTQIIEHLSAEYPNAADQIAEVATLLDTYNIHTEAIIITRIDNGIKVFCLSV